jgi:hypothetical protein
MSDFHVNSTGIIEPTNRDVLFGKEDSILYHVGNLSFRTLIGYCLSDYERLPTNKRSRKSQFIKVIVDLIIESGGRFLRRQKNGKWEVASIKASREKVGQELRDTMRRPHILQNFSLPYAECLGSHFNSAYDFDWKGIVQACENEIGVSPNLATLSDDLYDLLDQVEAL